MRQRSLSATFIFSILLGATIAVLCFMISYTKTKTYMIYNPVSIKPSAIKED
jgi:hypothetical protein